MMRCTDLSGIKLIFLLSPLMRVCLVCIILLFPAIISVYYFIFTLPETTTGYGVDAHGVVDNADAQNYQQQVNNAFANPGT